VQISEQFAALENCCGHFCGRFDGHAPSFTATERNDSYDPIIAERSMRDRIMAFGALHSNATIGDEIDRLVMLRRIARTRIRFECDVPLSLRSSSPVILTRSNAST
jgi:hypothetical protein